MNYKQKNELKKDADRCLQLLLNIEKAQGDLLSALILGKQRMKELIIKIDKIDVKKVK